MATPLSEQQQRVSSESGLSLYKEIAVGEGGFLTLLGYELITGIGIFLPGIIGAGFRSLLYPFLFQQCGVRPYVGKGVTVRNPGGCTLGRKVLLDDEVTVDCRKGSSIKLGDNCAVGKASILAAKGGDISLSDGVNIGTFCRLATQSGIQVGESTLIAAYVYIGPGNHQWDEESGSYMAGKMELKGGVTIGKNCWIGTRATILDGVTIGDGAMVGAHSLVREDVPAGAIVAGTPAKVIGKQEV